MNEYVRYDMHQMLHYIDTLLGLIVIVNHMQHIWLYITPIIIGCRYCFIIRHT